MARTITHKITDDETTPAMFGSADHLEYAQSHSFTQMIFATLTERAASEQEVKLLDLILNLSIDHGPNAPSSSKTIEVAEQEFGMGEAVGAGIQEINERHGGAGEPLMEMMYRIAKGSTVEEEVQRFLESGQRIPGLGHRVYKQSLPSNDGKEKDPRAQLIFDKADEMGLGRDFIKIVKEIRDELYKQSGTYLTVNIDGAIAAVLCGFGLDPKAGIAVFIIARTPGLCAHYINAESESE